MKETKTEIIEIRSSKKPKFCKKPEETTTTPTINEELENPQIVKNKLQYYSAIITRCFIYFASSLPFFMVNLTFPTIKNEKNMDLTENQEKNFLSLASSFFFIGLLLGYLISAFTGKMNTKTIQRIALIILLITYIMNLSTSPFLFIFSRIIQSAAGKFADSLSFGWVYELSLPKHRNSFSNLFLACYSFASIIMSVMAIFDNEGTVYWRLMYGVPILILILILFFDFFFVKDLNSVRYLLRKKGFDETLAIMRNVYEEKTAFCICKEFYAVMKPENKKKLGFFREVKQNKVEMKLMFLSGLGTGLSLSSVYGSLGLIIGSRDLDDSDEVRMTKIAISIGFVMESILNIGSLFYNFNQNKRKTAIIGSLAYLLSTVLVIIAYTSKIFLLAKVGVALSSTGSSILFLGVYSYWSQILPSNLNGLPFAVYGTLSVIFTLITPQIVSKGISDQDMVMFFGVCFFVQIIGIIFMLIGVKNLQGDKEAIRDQLRNLKKS